MDFLNYGKPVLTAMILCSTPQECIDKIRLSLQEGAEAFGIQLEKLRREYRTPEVLREIFGACEGKPIYITSYRSGENTGMTDEECMDWLLTGLSCGAKLCDVMGDLYCPSRWEFTENPEAVEKQKALIKRIHAMGGQVLMSCHTRSNLTVEENLKIAHAQADRGADVVKIVNTTESMADMAVCVESIRRVREETGKELLFLANGPAWKIRQFGPSLGVCMYLCLAFVGPMDNPRQPLLRDIKQVRDHLVF